MEPKSSYPFVSAEDALRQLFDTSLGLDQGRGRLKGRKVLVAGAGQRSTPDPESTIGNGRAMSILFAKEGGLVGCADIDVAAAQSTVDLIAAAGGRAVAIAADVAKPEEIHSMFDQAEQSLGVLDAVVANVGIANGKNLMTETSETWDQVLNINLRAHMLIGQRALSSLSPGGAILLISSLASVSPTGRNPAYEASKAALSALCRAQALEGQARGIRANALAPGLLDTPMGRAASARSPSRATRPLPFGRQGTAWEMAYAALFLISRESSYVNAQTIFVDGGLGSGVAITS
ncbi:MAG TPA: SDR family oxidoreductase [Verrucomicrobiae bacterium]|jgi:NAD(P)-dependent dehydrogenase (short-subunit alcohol dehydrogenase family)|nr:SDR family oxidoreductase [Verrucomicrobiae bacterium]